MSRGAIVCVVAVLTALLGGCPRSGERGIERPSLTPPSPVDDAVLIRLVAAPIAVDWTGDGKPDGVNVQVQFWHPGSDLPVAVNGEIEFLLYQGLISRDQLEKTPVSYHWKFNMGPMRANMVRSIVGWGYAFRLGWGEFVPSTSSVTLLARYYSPSGQPLADNPVVIAVTPH